MENGTLYVVATPIGNLEDISARALRILREVAAIAAEDTRHSKHLLDHFGITTPLFSLHEHNESERITSVIQRLQQGDSIALISDAGTPLISDPGFPLVRELRTQGFSVVPVPGCCAFVAALSAAGIATDRFAFEGFLPAKSSARRARLAQLETEPRTLIFYESSHRIQASLQDCANILGARVAALARELTKRYEEIRYAPLTELATAALEERGEFVLIVQGAPKKEASQAEAERILRILLQELPLKQAAALTAELTGMRKNQIYQWGVEL